MATLTLVTLPIGNVEDFTPRARAHMHKANYFLVEDTRKFKQFIKMAGISLADVVIDSFHEHSESKIEKIVQKMNAGVDITLLSDAGSPVISDPAYPLINKIVEQGHQLNTCPGVTSVIAALELSGLPPYPFHFYGFFPRGKDKGGNFLQNLSMVKGTHLFFEAPTRVDKTVHLISQIYPMAQVSLIREITKQYETVYRFTAHEYSKIRDQIITKGEFIIVFYLPKAISANNCDQQKLLALAEDYLEKGGGIKLLSKILSEITAKDSKEIYSTLSK